MTEQFDLPAVLTELLYGNEAVNNFVIDLRDLGRVWSPRSLGSLPLPSG